MAKRRNIMRREMLADFIRVLLRGLINASLRRY